MIEPYYSSDGITIYHGDCRDVLPYVQADVVVTDPPYGIGKAEWDDVFPAWFISLALKAAPKMAMIIGPAALPQVFANLNGSYKDMLALYAVNGMTHGRLCFGNYTPVVLAGEWKKKAVQSVIKFSVNPGLEQVRGHPTPKPLQAMYKLCKDWTDEYETILDPFMGSGTTLVAAKRLGRKAIGIEIEEKYCEIAVKRLAQTELFAAPPEPEQPKQLELA